MQHRFRTIMGSIPPLKGASCKSTVVLYSFSKFLREVKWRKHSLWLYNNAQELLNRALEGITAIRLLISPLNRI